MRHTRSTLGIRMTPILQDITILFGLCINGHIVIFDKVHNQVTLRESVFRLTLFYTKLKEGTCILNDLEEIFSTPPDVVVHEVLYNYVELLFEYVKYLFRLQISLFIKSLCKYTRVYTLHIFNNVLHIDFTRRCVPFIYLFFLKDLIMIPIYS